MIVEHFGERCVAPKPIETSSCGRRAARSERWRSSSSRPAIPTICREAGAEFILYDMEHSGVGFETMKAQFAFCRGLDLVPLVRVPSGDYHHIARALDIGAMGIMVPMVETSEQARAIVDCTQVSAGRTTRRRVQCRGA